MPVSARPAVATWSTPPPTSRPRGLPGPAPSFLRFGSSKIHAARAATNYTLRRLVAVHARAFSSTRPTPPADLSTIAGWFAEVRGGRNRVVVILVGCLSCFRVSRVDDTDQHVYPRG